MSVSHIRFMSDYGSPEHACIVRLRVDGAVIRTGFRGWAQKEALARGLDGWVRDRTDGWMELVLAGSPGAVEDMRQACMEGPPAARVSGVTDLEVAPDMPVWVGFHHLPPR